jgi:hypothetical protein
MSEYEVEFEFPDEKGSKTAGKEVADTPVIEIEDDTPTADRGREPLPKDLVAELEEDELEEYSEKVKVRLKQMKKVWHDERREKERAYREQQEAISATRRVMEENKRLKATLSEGERTLIDTYRGSAELELEMAKRSYKEAQDMGDTDKIVEAHTKFNAASYKLQQIANYRPTPLQEDRNDVIIEPSRAQVPTPDAKTVAWQERNPWWGTDVEMTSLAMGLHQKMEREHGRDFTGSDEYWSRVDKTMRHRFPEYFGGETVTGGGKPSARTDKPATVVAPASRSTSAKKIVLKQSQVNVAKRLGITPEQYAREFLKLENTHG